MVTVYEIGVRTYDFFEDGEMRRAHGPDRARGCAGIPHHGTPRGNRREWVFFGAEDYQFYRRLIATAARRDGAEIWAYCLPLRARIPDFAAVLATPADPAKTAQIERAPPIGRPLGAPE